ncbi:MAG: putrescine transport system ATP-binding protein [Mycobacteriales bacterium]
MRPARLAGRGTLAGIRLDGLVWDAGGAVGLPGVIEVQRGEVAAVVAAGAVGTTLADVLVGLARPLAGAAWVVGHGLDRPVDRPDPRLITLVPVGGALLPQRTVKQNIAFGDRVTADARRRKERVLALAQMFRVAGALRLHPHRLSPAQRLGVAAARALASKPLAVVVEDRSGQPDCASVVAALAGQDVAVVVITDSAERAAPLTTGIHTAGPPTGPPTGPEPPPRLDPPTRPGASDWVPPDQPEAGADDDLA